MRTLLILFLCLFFCRCNPKPEIIQVKLQTEELEVIKDTFYDVVCCYWQQMEYQGFKFIDNESRENESKRFKKWSDSIYIHLPEKINWFVKDTLYNTSDFSPSVKYYHNPRIKHDTSFDTLEKCLFTVRYPKQATKLNGLVIGNYTFESIDSLKKLGQTPKHGITFSRVTFNSKRNKACYYVTLSLPESHWASGQMIFVEKEQGKWHLLYRKLYWIT